MSTQLTRCSHFSSPSSSAAACLPSGLGNAEEDGRGGGPRAAPKASDVRGWIQREMIFLFIH
jgi:hypothetical protein